MRSYLLAALLAVALPARHAHAEAPAAAAEPVEYSHLGVQLRVLASGAYLYATQALGPEDTTIEGAGLLLDFALGAMVADELALNMDLVLGYAPSAQHGVLDDRVFTAVHVGAGLTYWFMPANVYLGASVGAATSSVEGNPVRIGIEVPASDPSHVGIGMHLCLGKQFWLTRRIGLGAGLSLLGSVASNPIGGEDTDRFVLGAALGLSFTLN